jgi:RNA polymerase sigma-70 factor (ECF subfamily)
MEAGPASVEAVARRSYGRLIAYLSARSRDVAASEDALADAFRAALEAWPRSGVPRNPEAWLLTTARRRLLDAGKHQRVAQAATATLLATMDAAAGLAQDSEVFPDERLELLFVCAHPAIDPGMHTPLMLQTVLGLDAARIGSAFLVAPKTMGQRLTRAKLKIKAANLRFEAPEADQLAPRIQAVLDAIYAAYCCGWDDAAAADLERPGFAEEALALGRLVPQLAPDQPEALGLLALMLHCEARRPARRHPDGAFAPLSDQDTALWDRGLIAEAEAVLTRAARLGAIGRYQLEAAIQSAHAERCVGGATDWAGVLLLYEGLVALSPSIGAAVGRIAAVARAKDPAAALTELKALPRVEVGAYQPYWALFADLCARTGQVAEAQGAYDRAAGLTSDPALRAFLARRKAELSST